MKTLSEQELIKLVTDSFDAERQHDVDRGLKLVAADFQQRGMFVSGDQLFPTFTGGDLRAQFEAAYAVEGREFHIWNIAANVETQTVFVELAEVEPRSGERAIWPYVLVCEVEDGKIKRSRHYGDPDTLRRIESVDQVQTAVQS